LNVKISLRKNNKRKAFWFEEFFGKDYIAADCQPNTLLESKFIKEVLSLKKGMNLLDTACGYGRHMLPLLKKGIGVVGCDLSGIMLTEAKKKLVSCGIENPKLINCDNRDLPFEETFDCACNMFNSFGYFDSEEDNFRVLKSVATALKPGGLFLIDLTNRDYMIRNFSEKDWFEKDGTYILEKRTFDPIKNRTEIDVIIIDKQGKRDYHHSIRVYTFTELSMLLEAAGFFVADVFGGFDFEEFEPRNGRMLVISGKRRGYEG
jgi:SAM-dependent methyltransferase